MMCNDLGGQILVAHLAVWVLFFLGLVILMRTFTTFLNVKLSFFFLLLFYFDFSKF